MNYTKKLLLCGFFIAFASVASSLTVSYVVGTQAMKFSAINFLLPLLGVFFNAVSACSALGFIFALKFLCKGLCITLGIPTALATFSWLAQKNKFADFTMHVIFPLTCMTLFIAHHTGSEAYAYSFYWLIPVALFFVKNILGIHTNFLMALQSTFTAHATGSIIVLYTLNLTAAAWNNLIPLVAVERLVMATGMTLSIMIIERALRLGHSAHPKKPGVKTIVSNFLN